MTRPARLPALLLTFGLLAATGCALDEGDISTDDAIDEPELGTAEAIGSDDDKCWVKAVEPQYHWNKYKAEAQAYCQPGNAATFTEILQKRREQGDTWFDVAKVTWTYEKSYSGYRVRFFSIGIGEEPRHCYRTKVIAFRQSEVSTSVCN